MKKAQITFLLLFLCTSVPCSAATLEEIGKIPDNTPLFTIHGSNTIGAHLGPNLIKAYLSTKGVKDTEINASGVENEQLVSGFFNNRRVSVYVAAHGSSTGFKGLQSKKADLAAASRPVKNKESRLFPETNMVDGMHEFVLGIDGLAIIVHRNNPIERLNIDQLGQIFSGQISNWSEIGGPNRPIHVYARDSKSGTYDTFNSQVLGRGYKLSNKAQRFESNEKLSDQVARDLGGIGFTALATINNAKAIKVNDMGASAFFPDTTTIATEDYPLARRLYFYKATSNNPFVKDFLNFATGPEGQNIVEQTGFVSQNILSYQNHPAPDMPVGYRVLAQSSKRLSVNFRFQADAMELDNKARADVKRLKLFFEQPENANKQIILFGFSSETSHQIRASLTSELRVNKVKEALRSAGISNSIELGGYGDINPVATNENTAYANKNNRVEVWIK
ncbi:substrate-binding domain-containing protein [Gynuella sp.]|uniref:substrate-binding domain-containing protein n=1 Tax=Gynuella sp. TaxID=2969146 RepID=UPI003D0ACEA3